MTAQHDLDRALGAWFQGEATTAPPPEPLARVIKATADLRPRPGPLASLGSSWIGSSWTREREMGRGMVSLRLTLVGVLVTALLLALLAAAMAWVGSQRQTDRFVPSTTTFTSPRYGYSAVIPATWSALPATETWPGGDGIEDPAPPYADVFHVGGASARIKAAAAPAGTSGSEWRTHLEAIRAKGGLCFGSATPWTDATAAGIAARRFEWRCDSPNASADYDEVMFLNAGTVYVITGNPAMVDVLVQSFGAP